MRELDGRPLDCAVHKEVFGKCAHARTHAPGGWASEESACADCGETGYPLAGPPHYTTDARATLSVVSSLNEQGLLLALDQVAVAGGVVRTRARFDRDGVTAGGAESERFGVAVCRAALASLASGT